jgi:hypothetical protein
MINVAKLMLILGAAMSLGVLSPSLAPAQPYQGIAAATHIANLEAHPKYFAPGQPIDFVVAIRYDGSPLEGFDVGVFHEGRLVGWLTNLRLNPGMNTFKLHDRHFTGDPGDYIVRLRYRGTILHERRFKTRSQKMYTIDPTAPFFWR